MSKIHGRPSEHAFPLSRYCIYNISCLRRGSSWELGKGSRRAFLVDSLNSLSQQLRITMKKFTAITVDGALDSLLMYFAKIIINSQQKLSEAPRVYYNQASTRYIRVMRAVQICRLQMLQSTSNHVEPNRSSNIKCIMIYLESKRIDRPIFVKTTETRFGTPERGRALA